MSIQRDEAVCHCDDAEVGRTLGDMEFCADCGGEIREIVRRSEQ